MKILITGGSGFLGSNLCKSIINYRRIEKLYCLDSLYTGSLDNIRSLKSNKKFVFINHDIRKYLKLDIDYIFNLACPASPPKYQQDPFLTLDTCYSGTKNILELAKKNNAVTFHASTSEIYGDPNVNPQSEEYFGNTNCYGPRSCYDEGKRIAETLIFEYQKKFNINVKIGRIFNTYGPMMDKYDGRVISNFINQSLSNKPITIYGDGKQTRSFCYVDDLIKVIKLLCFTKKNITSPINIGNNNETSIALIAKKIKRKTKSNSDIIFLKKPIDDPHIRRPDIRKAQKYLKWKPVVKLDDGLSKTIKYFKSLQ